MKKRVLFLFFLVNFIVFNVFSQTSGTTSVNLEPVTRGTFFILQQLRNSGERLDELSFFLSGSLRIIVLDEHNETPIPTIRNGVIVAEDNTPLFLEIKTTDMGRIFELTSEYIDVNFRTDNKDIMLRFRLDSHLNKFIPISARINTRLYNLSTKPDMPYLNVSADLGENINEVYAHISSAAQVPSQTSQVSISSPVSISSQTGEAHQYSIHYIRPQPPVFIMSQGVIPLDKMEQFFFQNNPEADRNFVRSLIGYYIEEAAIEGVNHDIAFAQMCHETGFLRYGNLVQPEWNNFAGIGATGPHQPGERFRSPHIGVRAHIQHLKAYGSVDPIRRALEDPRFLLVRRGSSPTISGLTGTWALDPQYAEKISNILHRLYSFSFQ